MAAALDCAAEGARVTLLERRRRLGGLTSSFEHNGRWIDNGQHVFLRCCTEYAGFLDRIGATGDVEIQGRLDIPVVAPGVGSGPPRVGRLRRSSLPAPLHLLGSLLRYPHISPRDRLNLGRAVSGLRRIDLEDPSLDEQSFGDWLASRGQSPAAIAALWDLITIPTVNLPAAEASLAMGAKVFKTGLLSDARAADIGWSRVPLDRLHGQRGGEALRRAGVDIRTEIRIEGIAVAPSGEEAARFQLGTEAGPISADAVIVALPHREAASVLPPDAVRHQGRLDELGTSAVVDVHLLFDRRVTDWPLMAGHDSAVQWVFDRTEASGLTPPGTTPESGTIEVGAAQAGPPQYLAVSLSAADDLLGRRPEDLISWISAELGRLLPGVRPARVLDSLVTKERYATFRAQPGSGDLRPSAQTAYAGLAVAGAWTATGWPATMEGAVRSGRAAARSVLSDLALAASGRPVPGRPDHEKTIRTTEEVA
jgi:squalene-associated FAD-dependent desaturase